MLSPELSALAANAHQEIVGQLCGVLKQIANRITFKDAGKISETISKSYQAYYDQGDQMSNTQEYMPPPNV